MLSDAGASNQRSVYIGRVHSDLRALPEKSVVGRKVTAGGGDVLINFKTFNPKCFL